MENMLLVYSVLIVFVNTMCDFWLSGIKNIAALSTRSVIPPFGMLMLLAHFLRRKKPTNEYKKWVVSRSNITNDEYDYIVDNATPEELGILFSPPKNRKQRKEVEKILAKYCKLFSLEYFKDMNKAFIY